MRGRPRAVVDTNLVVSALVFSRGRIAELRAAWQAGRFQPLVSRSTATELLRVLAYLQLSADERHDLLADYLPYCTTIKVPSRVPAVPHCRDPFDVPFLELAVVGKADHLVTGDKDLLSLAEGFPAEIVAADTFLSQLAERASDP